MKRGKPAPDALLVREDALHKAYAKGLTDDWVFKSCEEELDTLSSFCGGSMAVDPAAPFVISGEAGLGKSALLANWMQLRASSSDRPDKRELLLAHYVGCSPESSSLATLLFRVLTTIKTQFGLADMPVASLQDESKLRWDLLHFLQAVSRKRGSVVLAIDGVDRIRCSDGFGSVRWVPAELPPGVRLILSCSPGTRAAREFKRRGTPVMVLTPLSPPRKLDVLEAFFAHARVTLGREGVGPSAAHLVGKEDSSLTLALSTADKQALLDAPQTSNPRFLRLLLDFLLSSAHGCDNASSRLSSCLAAADVQQLLAVMMRLACGQLRDAFDDMSLKPMSPFSKMMEGSSFFASSRPSSRSSARSGKSRPRSRGATSTLSRRAAAGGRGASDGGAAAASASVSTPVMEPPASPMTLSKLMRDARQPVDMSPISSRRLAKTTSKKRRRRPDKLRKSASTVGMRSPSSSSPSPTAASPSPVKRSGSSRLTVGSTGSRRRRRRRGSRAASPERPEVTGDSPPGSPAPTAALTTTGRSGRRAAFTVTSRGDELLKRVLGLLMASRHGLTDDELWQLMGTVPADAKPVLLWMVRRLCITVELAHEGEPLLALRKLLDDQLCAYVQSTIMPELHESMLHTLLWQFFQRQPVSQRRLHELPYQLEWCKNWGRLKDTLTNILMFQRWWTDANRAELVGYWITLSRQTHHFDMVEEYVHAFTEYSAVHKPDVKEVYNVLGAITCFMACFAAYERDVPEMRRPAPPPVEVLWSMVAEVAAAASTKPKSGAAVSTGLASLLSGSMHPMSSITHAAAIAKRGRRAPKPAAKPVAPAPELAIGVHRRLSILRIDDAARPEVGYNYGRWIWAQYPMLAVALEAKLVDSLHIELEPPREKDLPLILRSPKKAGAAAASPSKSKRRGKKRTAAAGRGKGDRRSPAAVAAKSSPPSRPAASGGKSLAPSPSLPALKGGASGSSLGGGGRRSRMPSLALSRAGSTAGSRVSSRSAALSMSASSPALPSLLENPLDVLLGSAVKDDSFDLRLEELRVRLRDKRALYDKQHAVLKEKQRELAQARKEAEETARTEASLVASSGRVAELMQREMEVARDTKVAKAVRTFYGDIIKLCRRNQPKNDSILTTLEEQLQATIADIASVRATIKETVYDTRLVEAEVPAMQAALAETKDTHAEVLRRLRSRAPDKEALEAAMRAMNAGADAATAAAAAAAATAPSGKEQTLAEKLQAAAAAGHKLAKRSKTHGALDSDEEDSDDDSPLALSVKPVSFDAILAVGTGLSAIEEEQNDELSALLLGKEEEKKKEAEAPRRLSLASAPGDEAAASAHMVALLQRLRDRLGGRGITEPQQLDERLQRSSSVAADLEREIKSREAKLAALRDDLAAQTEKLGAMKFSASASSGLSVAVRDYDKALSKAEHLQENNAKRFEHVHTVEKQAFIGLLHIAGLLHMPELRDTGMGDTIPLLHAVSDRLLAISRNIADRRGKRSSKTDDSGKSDADPAADSAGDGTAAAGDGDGDMGERSTDGLPPATLVAIPSELRGLKDSILRSAPKMASNIMRGPARRRSLLAASSRLRPRLADVRTSVEEDKSYRPGTAGSTTSLASDGEPEPMDRRTIKNRRMPVDKRKSRRSAGRGDTPKYMQPTKRQQKLQALVSTMSAVDGAAAKLASTLKKRTA
eukprot:PLAT5675.1.p1 GENE.PLAT5675.1~~PLAT5675.1.p1  ORF type:complete len:1675 (-),score=816.12 PLAT5675.1:89-5113(-)